MNDEQYNKVKAACVAWVASGKRLVQREFRGPNCGCALTAYVETVLPDGQAPDGGAEIQELAEFELGASESQVGYFIDGFDDNHYDECVGAKTPVTRSWYDAGRRLAKEMGLP